MERFPASALFAPSWSPRECADETLAAADFEKAQALYIYGLGNGAAYRQIRGWLKQNEERELIFLEEDEGALASFLQKEEAFEILSDLQVQIVHFSKPRELDALAEKLPVERLEIAALPSKQGRKFQSLRLRLLRKTTLANALQQDRLHGYQPFQNFVRNAKRLPESFYANGLKGAFQGIPALVCGAGPSLQKSIETIKTLENKALIIAGGSTLAALSSQGISPHFGMAVDPNLEEYRRLRNSFAFEVPLLYSTRLFPAVFQTANGPFGYMRSGIGGVPELWIEEELGLLDPLLGDFLSPESMSVTMICIAWAQFLGCSPILLDGIDLAYTGKKRYASGVAEDEEMQFAAIDAEKSAADRILKKKDRLGQPVYTAVRWVMESASISHFARKHKEIQFINTTDGGIGFKGIEYLPIQKAAQIHLQNEYPLRKLVHEKIVQSSMPKNAAKCIASKMKELRQSLDRIVSHLEILAGKKKGSAALAELELRDEMAFPILFYDIHETFRRKETRWEKFLTLARQYQAVAGEEN